MMTPQNRMGGLHVGLPRPERCAGSAAPRVGGPAAAGWRAAANAAAARLAVAVVLAWAAGRAGAAEDGWTDLFDGKTLNGWVQKNGTATYRVVDGMIVGVTKEGSWNSFLCTEKEYGNFELEFDVKVDPGLNSGVQIRSKQRERTIGPGPNNAAGRVIGPQVEIESSGENGAEAGYIYAEATGLGWLTPKERLIPHKHFKDGQWNHYRVLAEGPRIRTWINGVPIEDLTDEKAYQMFPRGFIGLQVHRIKPGTGPFSVRWRNLRIRELP